VRLSEGKGGRERGRESRERVEDEYGGDRDGVGVRV
jgi:hypothetical protein